ncbi:MAG: hypothetical protein H6739_07490 [Alphaproteobacteria bacterium]|nr:hypothetical protein [Alphaproteobacteria bacterium]
MGDQQLAPAPQQALEDQGSDRVADVDGTSAVGMGDSQDPVIANAEALIADLEADRNVSFFSLRSALEALDSSSAEGAAQVAQRLRAAADAAGAFNSLQVQWAQEYHDRHVSGEERSFEANSDAALRHMIEVGMVLEVSRKPEHEALHTALNQLYTFYGVDAGSQYNDDLVSLAHQMRAFLDAGHQIGPAMWSQATIQMEDLDARILTAYAGTPAVRGCSTYQTFKEAYDLWVGVRGELEGGDYEAISTGDSKSELDAAASGASVPEYTEQSYDQTRRDCDLAIEDARQVVQRIRQQDRFTHPAHCQEAITRLQMMLPHMDSLQRDQANALLSDLRTLYETIPDPEDYDGPDASGGVSLDITRPFTVAALETALSTLANQPGEQGTLSFHGEIEAQIGNALIRGYVGALLDLSIGYAVTDTATCTLSFDASAAVRAGISFAGIASAGVEGGGGYNLAARFPNPGAAAAWLYAQFVAINEDAGGDVLGASGSSESGVDPVVVEEGRGTIAGQAEAELAGFGAEAEIRGTSANATFTQGGQTLQDETGAPLERTTNRTERTIGASYRAPAGWGMDASYTFTEETIQGDANAANDGSYQNHNVDIGFSLGRIINSTLPVSEALPSQSVQDGILDLFAQFESALPGGGVSRSVLYGVFDRVVAQIYDAARTGRENRMNARVSIGLTWNSVFEQASGEYHNQYFRVTVNPSFTRTLEVDGAVVSGEASITAAGSVVVLEELGSDTLTYIQQRREFRWNDQQWEEFVQNDPTAIQQVIDNLLNPEHHLHAPAFLRFAQAHGYPDGGFDAGLRALEQYLDSLPRQTRGSTE